MSSHNPDAPENASWTGSARTPVVFMRAGNGIVDVAGWLFRNLAATLLRH